MANRPDFEDPVTRLSQIDTTTLPADGGKRFNRLIFEKSPYLLQHAENPINWYPWGAEAFERARAENKPVFLSIGYSTCHWCHVMEKESFQDEKVAEVINRTFIPIKVDREERPDIDNTFMLLCQIMTGSGGWPLNLALAPDKKPFFAATYIPKWPRPGMPGLLQLANNIAELWRTDRARLLETGLKLGEALLKLESSSEETEPLGDKPMRTALDQFAEKFDKQYGGFKPAPKYPMPHNLSLLLRLSSRYHDEKAKFMALKTLEAMRMGGIFDQIGFGLHRYSVDEKWLVPHFEKMLYDQALTVLVCLEAWQVSKDACYNQMAREILLYVTRDLQNPEGGFFCGEDADSEGAEGTFYLWTRDQILSALGEEQGTVFCTCYNITEKGNFKDKNIPYLTGDMKSLAQNVNLEPNRLAKILDKAREKLFEVRQKRIRPHLDDKILTSWNGLSVAALARSGALLEEKGFIHAAQKAADFVLGNLCNERGRLLRRWRRGEAAILAFLEDYAFFILGLTELYMATFESRYLKEALNFSNQMETYFSDGHGNYFDTGSDSEPVLTRGRSTQDGALPSGNAVAALNLLRLGHLTGDPQWEEKGERLLANRFAQLKEYPLAFTQGLIALDFALGSVTEMILTSKNGSCPPEELLKPCRNRFLPKAVILFNKPNDPELSQLAPVVKGKEPLKGKAAAYLCQNRTCHEPVTSAKALEILLSE